MIKRAAVIQILKMATCSNRHEFLPCLKLMLKALESGEGK